MPLVTCDCGKRMKLKDGLAGKRVRCPACQAVLTVPDLDDEEAEAEPEPVKPKAKAPAKPVKPAARRPEPEPDEGDEEEERPRGKAKGKKGKKAKQSSSRLLVLLGVGGAIAVLLGGVVAVLVIMNQPSGANKPGPQANRDGKGDGAGDKDKGGQKKETDGKEKTPGGTAALTDEQLAKEFVGNMKATQQKYRGRMLEVTGVLDGPVGGNDKETLLLFRGSSDGKSPVGMVMCSLSPKERERLKDVTMGQSVKVSGKLEDNEIPFPKLVNCKVIDIGKPLPIVYTLTAEELMKEYFANKPAAIQKYDGKRVALSGPVDRAFGTQAWLTGFTPDPLKGSGTVICELPRDDEVRTAALSKNQVVKLQGRVVATDQIVMLHDCRLLEVGKDTATVLTAAQLTKEFAADKEATAKKYHDQPLLIEGKVAEIQRKDNNYTFLLAGHDDAGDKPLRVLVQFPGLISKQSEDQLAKVAAGQTVRVRGVGSIFAFEDSISLNMASLQMPGGGTGQKTEAEKLQHDPTSEWALRDSNP